MCGQHALNMLIQDNLFSAGELGEIANRLDDEQRALNGYPANFVSENANASGFFSVQVLEKALTHVGLSLRRLNHPTMEYLMKDPSKGRAYIVNHQQHWFAVRRFGKLWFILNSQDAGPRHITDSYLNLFFLHLVENGCSIFHVEGELPFCRADEAAFNGKIVVKERIDNDKALQSALRISSETIQDDEFQRVIQMSREEHELEEALKRSMMENVKTGDSNSVNEAESENTMSTLSDLIEQDDSDSSVLQQNPERMETDTGPLEGETFVQTPLEEALLGENGQDPLPASTLMICVDRLYQSFTNLITDYFPYPSIAMPQYSDIKELAEHDVKTFKEACNELTAEFTKTATEWQLVSPEEAYEDEARDLEKAIKRQEELQRRIEERLKTESDKVDTKGSR
ncbi:hypothetical protein FO519_009311 [Halicephalobus sp. NKZ332]|nr:hypothetical protein FO519_009311 [Halicephalobus sp. NKZ332]